MYQFKGMQDTIVAVATPTGTGGIGIVRLSGPDAIMIADGLFQTKSGKKPSTFESFKCHYGWLGAPGGSGYVDEALLTVFRRPKSYTAEDVVEIGCHGGHVPLKAVITLALELGARLAEPGEFTKRAYLNGRIDLVEAEAVLDVITAQTDASLRMSVQQLKGELSTELENIRETLMNVYTQFEAIVNFPEDDLDAEGRQQIIESIAACRDRVEDLLRSSHNGRILKEGIRVVLCGKPNVGKSSLLNALLKQQRAIVTDIAGTTRDVLEESAHIRGIPLVLVDTAGILEPRDLIEEEAIKRSHHSIASADLVLLVMDGSRQISDEDRLLLEKTAGSDVLVVINKTDLPNALNEAELSVLLKDLKVLRVSALDQKSMEKLEGAIVDCVWQEGHAGVHGLMINNVRHVQALKSAQNFIKGAIAVTDQGIALEFASEEIKNAVNQLDAVTGRNIDTDLIDRIFSRFCIGK